MKKEQNVSVTALREGTFDFSFASEESNKKYYSFIPEVTGTYVIQATNSYEDLAPEIKWIQMSWKRMKNGEQMTGN